MFRHNPLMQSNSKKNIEIVRPQIIQNTITQSNDNIIIDKLQNDTILIAKDDKIISSSYSIRDLILETKNIIPSPLQAGENINIIDNTISTEIYNDTDVRTKIQATHENVETQFAKQSQKNQEFQNLIQLNNENMVKSHEALVIKLENSDEKREALNINMDQIAEQVGKDIKEVYKTIDDVKKQNKLLTKGINSNIKDLAAFYKEEIEKVKGVISENITKTDIRLNEVIDKVEQCDKNFKETLDQNNKIYDDKLTDMSRMLQENMANNEKRIQDNIANIFEELSRKFDQKLQDKDVEITKLTKTMESIYKEVVVVKDLDPNSKQLQKLIKQLTDKVTLIDKHFKFEMPK